MLLQRPLLRAGLAAQCGLVALPSFGQDCQPAQALVAISETEGMTIDLTETDNGRSLTVTAGDTLNITLPENATTGYVWDLEPTDPAHFSLVDKASNYPGPAIGSGGQITFRIQAIGVGHGTVSLVNRRPWEDISAEAKRFAVQVTIGP